MFNVLRSADETTAKWPVPTELKQTMEDMKMAHQALPLAVYDQQGNYVEPAMVQSMVKGSLVQMHFRVRHYIMKSAGVSYDCFSR